MSRRRSAGVMDLSRRAWRREDGTAISVFCALESQVRPMLHMMKMAVGIGEMGQLRAWQRQQAARRPPPRHRTRTRPSRTGDLLAGGLDLLGVRGRVAGAPAAARRSGGRLGRRVSVRRACAGSGAGGGGGAAAAGVPRMALSGAVGGAAGSGAGEGVGGAGGDARGHASGTARAGAALILGDMDGRRHARQVGGVRGGDWGWDRRDGRAWWWGWEALPQR